MDNLEKRITFSLCGKQHQKLVSAWWNKPHVVEFWDNSPEMWNNFLNFLDGGKEIFDYWIGYFDHKPFCFILTSTLETTIDSDDPYPIDHIIPWMNDKQRNTTFDFMIGEEAYLGKGLSYRALRQFMRTLGSSTDVFFIDPAVNNPKALHVYQRAGFEILTTFISRSGEHKGEKHYLMKATRALSDA